MADTFFDLHERFKRFDTNHGPDTCATCKVEAEDVRVAEENKKFDNQLWTFTAVNNKTGVESVLYGHATNSVFIYALAQADHEDSWLKVTKYEKPEPFFAYPDVYYTNGL